MSKMFFRAVVVAGCGLLLTSFASAAPVGTAFTYQGRLDEAFGPANGVYDFRFVLWNDVVGGTAFGSLAIEDVDVVDGLFVVDLDFGSIGYEEDALWLAIAVGPDDGEQEELFPRQRLRPAPVALGALSVADGSVGAAEVDSSEVQLRVSDSCGPDASIASISADGTVVCEVDDEGGPPLWFPPGESYVGPGLIHTGADLVGVNTQNPMATLHVFDAGSTLPAILVEDATSSEGDLAFVNGEALQIGDFQPGPNTFTTHMWLDATGEVRIVSDLTFDQTTGDKISLFGDRIGSSTMYGFGVSSGTLHYKSNGAHSWFIADADPSTASPSMHLIEGGLGIGTTNIPASYRLAVNGSVRAKEIVVETGWADDVFEPGYRLASLAEIDAHIREHGHLQGIPSTAEVEAGGVPLGETTSMLLRKIEELTLHLIELDREVRALRRDAEATP